MPEDHRVYAIGDIHGRLDLLHKMQQAIAVDIAENPVGRVTEIFLGDYVDRGEASNEVIAFLSGPQPSGRERICLTGNHEDALLASLEDTEALSRWLSYGASATIRSYGVEPGDFRDDPPALQAAFRAALPADHLAFLRGLPVHHQIGDVFFVHAGIRPGIPIDQQRREDMIWIRDDFLRSREPLPVHVVHGHTPVDYPDHRTYRTNIDTGAVYGGALTAAVIEGDGVEFLSIPSNGGTGR
ncbi:serine/threonine protein phosphatase [Acuticoccus sp. M5D2P5]|uniref:metallophosphoesterase family protein n=1 Tax=Acuticoccus kalidii TaxID=2910977 RepID=UPI001F31F44E|nr:metallophosphoesterase family protein [Acuticoccus kalidii]MCF3936541.1 serine/threonine protein phosphatase [Acuticoccus kalidii]